MLVSPLFWLRSCPRCSGDLTLDANAEDILCLQCGYYLTEEDLGRLGLRSLAMP